MSIHENHPFHIVNKRPWPLTGAIGAIITLIRLIKWFHQYNNSLLGAGAIISVLTIILWWWDVTREGTYQGLHTKMVTKGLRFHSTHFGCSAKKEQILCDNKNILMKHLKGRFLSTFIQGFTCNLSLRMYSFYVTFKLCVWGRGIRCVQFVWYLLYSSAFRRWRLSLSSKQNGQVSDSLKL